MVFWPQVTQEKSVAKILSQTVNPLLGHRLLLEMTIKEFTVRNTTHTLKKVCTKVKEIIFMSKSILSSKNLTYRWSKCMSYYLATIWNHNVTTEKYTTIKTFQNKLANDNEHGIKVSQNNLQCKYKLLFDLHLFWKKTREKARPSYDFFLTHTFNAFDSLDYSYFTSLNIKKKKIFRKPYTGLLQCYQF